MILLLCKVSAFGSDDPVSLTFSKTASPSVISQSLAGAGTAMPQGGFQGLVNPALTAAIPMLGSRGVFTAGYGRDKVFDDLVLPFGAVFGDGKGGGMGLYYRYLSGGRGGIHDATVNFASRLFDQMDAQGAVECGFNFRYENTDWRHDMGVDEYGEQISVKVRSQNLLLDVGFYQPHVLPGLDFSLVIINLTGYGWSEIDGEESESWIRGRHRSLTAGVLYTLPLLSGNLTFRLPVDLEFANLFEKDLPTKYIIRAGLDTRILQIVSVRFGYANAPEEPLELITDFNHKNLFYGGIGVFVKPFQVDFFAGKDEFGVTASYWY